MTLMQLWLLIGAFLILKDMHKDAAVVLGLIVLILCALVQIVGYLL